jgi:hypothetical protein
MDLERLAARLATRPRWQLALVLAALGFACVLPSLALGIEALDDIPQRNFILAHLHGTGGAQQRPWYDIYNLSSGDEVVGIRERFNWMRPWWAWPGLKVRFFRPVAAATLYVDYALVGSRMWLAHLHSALWYAAACFCISLLLLRLSRQRAPALLGALFFVLDDAHASPAAWLAGRNALIAATFVALSMLSYDRACRDGPRRWAWLSGACLLLALLAAENVVSALPWFVGYAWLLDDRPPARRLAALAGIVAAAGAWFAAHHLLGFGTRGSGAYLDPIFDSAAYLAALPLRYEMLWHAQFAAPWALLGPLPFWLLVAIDRFQFWLLVPALLVFVARNADRNRELAFWSFCALLGLVPLTAADPNERLLVHTGVAFWMVVAHFVTALAHASAQRRGLPRAVLALCVALIVIVHAALSPIALAKSAGPQPTRGTPFAARVLDRDPVWRYRDLLLVNVPSLLTPLLMATERVKQKLPLPLRISALGATDHEVEVTRLDARTIELYCPAGYLLDSFSDFWRGPSVPLRQGERIGLHAYDVQVLRVTADHRPLRMRMRFDAPLEDPSLKFVYWDGHDFAVFAFPAIGRRRIIRAGYDRTGQIPEELVR